MPTFSSTGLASAVDRVSYTIFRRPSIHPVIRDKNSSPSSVSWLPRLDRRISVTPRVVSSRLIWALKADWVMWASWAARAKLPTRP